MLRIERLEPIDDVKDLRRQEKEPTRSEASTTGHDAQPRPELLNRGRKVANPAGKPSYLISRIRHLREEHIPEADCRVLDRVAGNPDP